MTEAATGPSVGVRLSKDREHIVIVYGDEEEVAYYGIYSPEGALKIADHLKKLANSILQIRNEDEVKLN